MQNCAIQLPHQGNIQTHIFRFSFGALATGALEGTWTIVHYQMRKWPGVRLMSMTHPHPVWYSKTFQVGQLVVKFVINLLKDVWHYHVSNELGQWCMSTSVRGHFRNGKVSGWVAPGDSISTRDANVGKVVMSCCITMLQCIIVCHDCCSITNQHTIIYMYHTCMWIIMWPVYTRLSDDTHEPPPHHHPSLNHTITVQKMRVFTPSLLPTSSPDHCSHQRGRFVSAPYPCCTWQFTTAMAVASRVLKLTKPKPLSHSWWCVPAWP